MFSARRMEPADRAQVAELATVTGTRVELDEEIAREYAELWVACRGSDIVAYALVWWVGDEMQLVDIATSQGERRQGAASHLLQALFSAARKRGCARAELEVRAGNVGASALYQQLGFTLRRRRIGYYNDGEDALEMVLAL